MKRCWATLVAIPMCTCVTFVHAQAAGEMDAQVTQLDAMAAQLDPGQVATRIAERFVTLAGSEENARILVNALHAGTEFHLTAAGVDKCDGASTLRFAPPASRLGWGDALAALALAQDMLARVGITHPSSPELQSALFGGGVAGVDGKKVVLKGVLSQRAEGAAWTQIAQASGAQIDPVVTFMSATRASVASISR